MVFDFEKTSGSCLSFVLSRKPGASLVALRSHFLPTPQVEKVMQGIPEGEREDEEGGSDSGVTRREGLRTEEQVGLVRKRVLDGVFLFFLSGDILDYIYAWCFIF